MIFVNFKVYKEGTGSEAIKLIRVLEEVAVKTQIKIIPVVQAADIKEAVESTKLEVWTQHVDPVEFGAFTGNIIPEAVFEDGAIGTFLNHSEHKFADFDTLAKANSKAKEVGLKTLIFAGDINGLTNVLKLSPDYVSYEPPELVGSKTTSVAQAKPEIISQAVILAKEKGVPLIVGAGIKSADDIRKSNELGASGFAIASSIVTATDPAKELLDLCEGYK
ncbi:hypothetical protein A2955_00255 [Candidatus Woesebacteria bacterium RIFCSPLOWO2_01_FULL_37_19]|uniref:Uncharacterized protein n=2 Tax=Candidatus Woeseibacteriota TaxID=1752722 RepID=A0A1F8BAT8_9BACT|nr:MAG: hypothetical protein A2771_01145 [Candidatus Woesebacteria bacterium RIFCSPHIGHO2_01_FULL_38_26b]OGM61162.1 MAG: hypothetical protein A2955_00255 [Candidatus Woesebacteria bacterium RIFCSPLOWO2_01_FULL_37_19]